MDFLRMTKEPYDSLAFSSPNSVHHYVGYAAPEFLVIILFLPNTSTNFLVFF